jgi:hypothetical protein
MMLNRWVRERLPINPIRHRLDRLGQCWSFPLTGLGVSDQ